MKAIAFIVFFGSIVIASEESLTELQKSKAEGFKLEQQLFQCQAQLSSMLLTNKKAQLEKEFTNDDKEKSFNWDSFAITTTPTK